MVRAVAWVGAVAVAVLIGSMVAGPVGNRFYNGCADYTVVGWRSPGAWETAQEHGDRILGERYVEEATFITWASNPLAAELPLWRVASLEWEMPDGGRLRLESSRDGVVASLAGTAADATPDAIAPLLDVVDGAETGGWTLSEHGGATRPELTIDTFVAAWGQPMAGTQIPLGFLFILVSDGHELRWEGPEGTLVISLGLDLVPIMSDWAIFSVDSADRVDATVRGRASRAEVVAIASAALPRLGLAPPDGATWSAWFSCEDQVWGPSTAHPNP